MDSALQSLLSISFVLFCLAISAVVYMVRTVVEYYLSNNPVFNKYEKLWKDLILPIAPIIFGLIGCIFMHVEHKIQFGLVSGLLSGLVFRVVKSMISSKATAEPTESQ